jgi:hypothetical protein
MKKVLIGIIILVANLFLASIGLEYYLGIQISKLINTNQDRKYDILFEDLSINFLKRGVSLKIIRLVPLEKDPITKVSGSLKSIELSGVSFVDLVFNRKLTINQLSLNDPGFRITRKDVQGRPQDNSKALQGVFQDIISRGVISNFELINGTAEFFVDGDSLYSFAQFTDLNIFAEGIVTDSIIIQNAVPFQLESISMSLKNLSVKTEADQAFKFAELRFDSDIKSIQIKDISLKYKDYEKYLKSIDYQTDVIELTLKDFTLSYLNAKNNIYGDWQIVAGLASLDSLMIDDFRDKNKNRPDEFEKPLFEGMIERIPFPIELDTIRITNSAIFYRELIPGNSKPGILKFDQLNAEILNVISSDSLQGDTQMTVAANAVFNDVANIDMGIQMGYGKPSFSLQAKVKSFELSGINNILERMANVRVSSGVVRELALNMEVGRYASYNQMTFQYEDLKLELLGKDHVKKKLVSTIANIFTSKSNLKTDRNYKDMVYKTKRNIYRGPFHLLWQSNKDGLIQIVPGDVAQLFID